MPAVETESRDGLITKKQVSDLYQIHPKTVEARVRAGRIPKAVTGFGTRSVRWSKRQVLEHIDQMVAAARNERVA